jgi:hypothetical protein
MPKVPFTAFFQGPLAVYPIQTGQQDPITGGAYLGTDFLEGNYADVSNEDAANWNSQYGTQLMGGRYRICRVATYANSGGFPATAGAGGVVGWADGTSVQSVVIANAGSGATTDGTYPCASTYTPGSQSPAMAQVVISGGKMISASVIQGGGPFGRSSLTPTFGLTEIAGLGGGASLLAQLKQSSSYITSFDSTAISDISLVKGICYTPLTAAQITAGSWVVVQESGIAQAQVGTTTQSAVGDQAVATATATGGVVTTQTPAYSALEVGFVLAVPAVGATVPVKLTIPVVED